VTNKQRRRQQYEQP